MVIPGQFVACRLETDGAKPTQTVSSKDGVIGGLFFLLCLRVTNITSTRKKKFPEPGSLPPPPPPPARQGARNVGFAQLVDVRAFRSSERIYLTKYFV